MWRDGKGLLSQETLTPLNCLIRSLGQPAVPLSAARLVAIETTGSPRCCTLSLTPASGLAVGLPNRAVLACL